MTKELFEYLRVGRTGTVSSLAVLGDGVIAVQDVFHHGSGFRLYFDSGAEGRTKVNGGFDLWELEDRSFDRIHGDDGQEWLEAAKQVVDAPWFDRPQELTIPLDLQAS